MPRPVSTATLRPELGQLAYEFAVEKSQMDFIAEAVLPTFETELQSAQYPVIPSEAFMKLYDTKRAARANYKRSDYVFDFGTYACVDHGWEEAIDDREAALYSRFFDAEVVATKRATDIILRNREKRVADFAMDTGTFANGGVTVKWSDTEASDPRGDVQAAITAVRGATGMTPNAVVMSEASFQNVLKAKAFNEAVKYTESIQTQPRATQIARVAAYLGVDRVLVGSAMYDTKVKGQSTVPGSIWSDVRVLVARLAVTPNDLQEPCIGRSFLWTQRASGLLVTESYRDERSASNIIRVRNDIDEAAVFAACGYVMTNIA